MWQAGDLLMHRFNPDLGIGRVVALEGRTLLVRFPRAETELRMSTSAEALVPLVLGAGSRARVDASGEEVVVAEPLRDGEDGYRLSDGRTVGRGALWPLETKLSVIDRLARRELGDYRDFANRMDAARLLAMRRGTALASFLGGRIRLYPHQLHVAERATAADPVRWLLADEVGLGKTVEACLILNHLERTGKAERALVVAPPTLTVQWLGELYRKYHQVFVHLDSERLDDVAKDLGADFNPFEAHPRAVISLDLLIERPALVAAAQEAGLDLLVVDEAHHLERPPGQPGNPAYRAVAPLTETARHVLLLTATPLAEDVHGFVRLLELLRPDDDATGESFQARIERGDPLPPCTSSTRRTDIGGFPPRIGLPVELPLSPGLDGWLELEAETVAMPAADAPARRKKIERLRRVLSSPAAVPPPRDAVGQTWLARMEALSDADPRLEWLAREALAWHEVGEKTLIFVAFKETLEALRKRLELRLKRRVALFHEDLPSGRRDIEVAQFRAPGGTSVLVSTECGGEGRNFEFCRRIVLFDLPWDPQQLEQRIGRLDRIGREVPVEIVYFRPHRGLARTLATVLEATGAFEAPLAGVTHELAALEAEFERAALEPDAMDLDAARFTAAISEARAALGRIEGGAYQELHRDPYRASMADSILSRIPPGLEPLTEKVVMDACERLGFDVVPERRRATYSIEFGARAMVDQIPGVPGGKRFLGTFDREEAVISETVDFFSAGHALVEGLLLELEDGDRGRTAAFELVLETAAPAPDASMRGSWGLIAIFADDPRPVWCVDARGRRHAPWEERIAAGLTTVRRLPREEIEELDEWPEIVKRLASALPKDREPAAVALVRWAD